MSGGQDCRISLAASKPVSKDVLYFSCFSSNHAAMSKDPIQASKIISGLGLELNIVDITDVAVDDDMTQIFQKNSYRSHNRRAIKAIMQDLPKGMLHIRSNIIELIRETTYAAKNGDGESIQRSLYANMISDKMCRSIFNEFSHRNEYEKGLYNYHIGDILYWEYRLPDFVNSLCLLETDWCFDTYMLFNVRKVLEYGLSVPRYFKMNNRIPFELEKRLWPETLFYIPNTNYSLLDYYSLESDGRVEAFPDDSHSVTVDNIQGTMQDNETQMPYCQSGRYSITIGFNRSIVKKGDRISYDREMTVPADGGYNLQLGLLVEIAEEEYSSECIICLNDREMCRFSLNSMMGIETQINIIDVYKVKDKINLSVQLVSDKEYVFTNGIAGMLTIKSINLVRCSHETTKKCPIVISTHSFGLDNV